MARAVWAIQLSHYKAELYAAILYGWGRPYAFTKNWVSNTPLSQGESWELEFLNLSHDIR